MEACEHYTIHCMFHTRQPWGTFFFNVHYSGGNRLHSHSLSPSRPPNNTLNTRQQRIQVQGHIRHARARAVRRVPQMPRVRSGRGRHSKVNNKDVFYVYTCL